MVLCLVPFKGVSCQLFEAMVYAKIPKATRLARMRGLGPHPSSLRGSLSVLFPLVLVDSLREQFYFGGLKGLLDQLPVRLLDPLPVEIGLHLLSGLFQAP